MILAEHFWDFVRSYRRWIRPVVFENVRKVMACRTPALGCHVYACPQCSEIKVVPHSCKSRFCPTCGKHRTDVWADSVLNDLLDVPYHHLVLSVPWQLRPTIATNRKVGLDILFQAAILSITDWAKTVHEMRMGIVAVLHTFGSDLRFHPHVHLIVTGGGLSLDGQRWIATDPRFLMPHMGLKKRWRYQVIRLFREAHKEGRLRFFGKSSFLVAFPLFNAMLRKLYKIVWYAHIGASLLDPRFTVRYIGRYTKRAVLAEYRITHYDGKVVRFAFKDYAQGGKTSYKTLPVEAFIGRLVRHIPDKGFHMVRHAGLFCKRWKARYLPMARRTMGHEEAGSTCDSDQADRTSLLPWRDRQMSFCGEDPLCCPRCSKPMVFVGAFFGAHEGIQALFDRAGLSHAPWERAGLKASPG